MSASPDCAVEVNNHSALTSNLLIIRCGESATYNEHPEFVRAQKEFAGQTVNTLWSFTLERDEVNGIPVVKCEGHHSCVCGVCW